MTTIPVFETPRLVARHWTLDDAEAYFAIFSDTEVYRFLPGRAITTLEEAREHLQRIHDRHYQPSNGALGFFAMVWQSSMQPVPWLGLLPFPSNGTCTTREECWKLPAAKSG